VGQGDELEVRGHSRFDRKAGLGSRLLSWVADFFFGICLTEILYVACRLEPVLDVKLGVLAVFFTLGLAIPCRKFLGGSLGERIWRIHGGLTRAREPSYDWIGSFLTFCLIAISVAVFETKIATHPYWSEAETIRLQATVPPSDWRVLAFYYSLAPWPVSIQGRPVFYSAPYEVGPPQRFIGHIESDWIHESVRLRFEGPKTPMDYQSRALSREELKKCFSNSPLSYLLMNPSCVDIRRKTLERSLEELHDEGYAQFETSWFYVDNPALSDDLRTQGVRLRARALGLLKARIQDRYILISPNGIHQTIALSYLENEEGISAERDFKTSLGALQISEDITAGRAWVDHLLESTKLSQLPATTEGPGYLETLAQIQSVLISKLSVDPASFDAYYHLAGSDLLLLKYCAKYSDPDLKSLAQAMVERLNRYAHDVSAKYTENNSKLPMIERLAQDARQF
jgi:hypothetical protein